MLNKCIYILLCIGGCKCMHVCVLQWVYITSCLVCSTTQHRGAECQTTDQLQRSARSKVRLIIRFYRAAGLSSGLYCVCTHSIRVCVCRPLLWVRVHVWDGVIKRGCVRLILYRRIVGLLGLENELTLLTLINLRPLSPCLVLSLSFTHTQKEN